MVENLDALKENELVDVDGGAAYTGACWVYVIQPGDCLSVLAARFGVKQSVLQEINGIKNPDLIYAGHKLLVPYRA